MRICQNKITDEIRELFGANPVKIPETRIQPMCILKIVGKKPEFKGDFKNLIKGVFPAPPDILSSTVAQVSGMKTRSIGLNVGFDILKNLLKPLGIDSGVVSGSLNNTKKIAFSFDNVKRLYFDSLALGKFISDNNLVGDTGNPFITEILKSKDARLALITDVFVSNNFSLSSYAENDVAADINIPLVEQYLANVNLDVEVKTKAANEISFVGKESLSYAFTCVEISMNEQGVFSIGNSIDNLKAKGMRGEAIEDPLSDEQLFEKSKLLINQTKAAPTLLEF